MRALGSCSWFWKLFSSSCCRWLATATGIPFRLLTEVELEAAARGEAGRLFPYGNEYAPLWSCGIDARVGRTVPVGVFPLGDSPAGVSDMSGNTNTWTSTAWGTDPFEPTYRYPYVPDDGREEADTDAAVRRIVRGASFRCMSVRARATCRGRSLPGYRTRYTGLRLGADVDDEGIGRAVRMR